NSFLAEEEIINHLNKHGIKNSEKLFVNKSRIFRHILSHQNIFASFYHIRIEESVEIAGGNFYEPSDIQMLPKSVLINNYLKENIF
ncbi:MAG: hypothetical protein ACK4ND_07275, partial [Cytophagaceae bacterium]